MVFQFLYWFKDQDSARSHPFCSKPPKNISRFQVTFLLATSLGTPQHVFTAMLRNVADALHSARRFDRDAEAFHLSLWDVNEAWRSQIFGAGRSVGCELIPVEAMELPCEILEALLSWLWNLEEGLEKAYWMILDAAAASATGSDANCKTSLLLRHTAAQNISRWSSSHGPGTMTNTWQCENQENKHHGNDNKMV